MCSQSLFFFNDTATTEIYTLSLHDALPISFVGCREDGPIPHDLILARHGEKGVQNLTGASVDRPVFDFRWSKDRDRKSTRLNSSHQIISYAVFCLKKKKHHTITHDNTIGLL